MASPYPFAALHLLLTSCRLKRWLQREEEPVSPVASACDEVDVTQAQQLLELGLLDSLLPHLTETLCSRPSPAPPPAASRPREKTPGRGRRRDRDRQSHMELNLTGQEVIITIQVQDDAQRRCQEFSCAKSALLEHMPYFRDVVRGQQLENVDITIHCELTVFDWLMRWLESRTAGTEPPTLSADVVVSVLGSADFLGMEPLVEQCVTFIGGRLTAVADRPGMACLNDRLMARLAVLFDHHSVEALSEHERLRNRLYCQLTARLCGARARPSSGSQRTAALLFRCVDCGRLLLPAVASHVPCSARNLAVGSDGGVVYRHRPDSDWQLGAHVTQLRRQLRSWRLVYWRLWAAAHFLWCVRCEAPFAAAQLAGCRFHPEPARHGALARSAVTPLGHHPCCGGTALQFDPLPLGAAAGCLLRDHLVQPAPHRALRAEPGVYEDLLAHRSLAAEPPPAAGVADAANVGRDAAPLYAQMELQLMPAGSGGDSGLLPASLRPGEGEVAAATAAAEPARSVSLDSADFTASDDEEEGSPPAGAATAARPRTFQLRRHGGGHPEPALLPPPAVWMPTASTRHNQDVQRHRETCELRRLAEQLSGRQAEWRGRRGPATAGTFLAIKREVRASAEPLGADARHRRGRRK